ncbi:MAG TPA: hypothetical protein DDY77_03090 [Clostridiales bacterium]|nr:hypothetical protein [Clostridiales bacterium]
MSSNLLSVFVNVFESFGSPYTLGWLGNLIKALIEGCSSIGVGIILFTLILKAVTLPFDIYSRISTKKNALKMEKMRPELEKLQRQYANDPAKYNQKVQAIYKEQGYGMLSTCLPTIVTLVIFIIVINQFSNYSNYTNLNMINGMAKAYSDKFEEYTIGEYDEDGVLIKEYKQDGKKRVLIKVKDKYYLSEQQVYDTEDIYKEAREVAGIIKTNSAKNAYAATYSSTNELELCKLADKLVKEGLTGVKVGTDEKHDEILVTDGAYKLNTKAYNDDKTVAEINAEVSGKVVQFLSERYMNTEIKSAARTAAKESYEDNRPSFLWIKNLWVPDLPWKHPVQPSLKDYDFYKNLDKTLDGVNQSYFEEITADLTKEKTEPNGYMILVVLSIGIMLLSQIIMQKMQKPQLELQSVGGTAASTSKMMMWMMPVMFGVFAFIYTASFSLYMIVSSIVSTLSTLIINKIVEASFAKKVEAERMQNDKRFAIARKSEDANKDKKSKK